MALYVPTEVQMSVNYKYWFILSEINRVSEYNGYCTLSNKKLASKFKGLTKQTLNKYIDEMVSLGYIKKYIKWGPNKSYNTAFSISMNIYDMFINDDILAHKPEIPDGYGEK